MKLHFALLISVFACMPLRGEDALALDQSWRSKVPVPPMVKLTLRLPATVVIGHEIPAALVVHNEGADAIEITTGGDYRSTGYPLRMKVRVQDAAGNMLPDLPSEVYGFNGGGLSGPKEIQPRGSAEIEFPLDCYVSFNKPGVYTVTAGHDLGWRVDQAHPHPVAKATMTVSEPTAAEAADYVKAVFAKQPTATPATNSDVLQQEWKLEKTLCVLRRPIYLPALIRHAQVGSKAAVKGIGHIATQEATQALLTLLEHRDAVIVETSAEQLLRRLPSLESPDKPSKQFIWGSRYQFEPLLPGSWDARFDQPLLTAALKMLSHESAAVVQRAGNILNTRGSAEHAPALLAVLQKSLEVYHEPESGSKANTLWLPKSQEALLSALDSLRKRGWRLEEDAGGGTAHLVAKFRQLADKDVPKPPNDEWKTSMLTWVENGPKALKISALQALPQPLSDAAAKAVMAALNDKDLGVMHEACEVAGRSKRREFRKPLVQIIETVFDSFVHHAAEGAAKACGARMELWEALASTIVDQDLMCDAISSLIKGTIELPTSSGGGGNSGYTREQRFALRDAWRGFLQLHRKQLAAGLKIKPPSAATAAALTGANFCPESPVAEIHFKDGSRWPPKVRK